MKRKLFTELILKGIKREEDLLMMLAREHAKYFTYFK